MGNTLWHLFVSAQLSPGMVAFRRGTDKELCRGKYDKNINCSRMY